MGTLFLNEQNLLAIVEQLTVRASWAVAAATIGASEALMYQWLDKSRKAEAVRDESSPFFFTGRDEANFYHRRAARARRDNLLSLSALIADRLKFGHESICYDPSTGRPLQALDPKYLGVPDAEMEAQGLRPSIDRFLWERDPITDERLAPIFQTRTTDMPSSLQAVALRGLLPSVFSEKSEVTHNVNGAVTHIIEPAKFVPRAERLAIEAKERGEVVDATFTEVTPERPDVAALRAEWEARKADPNRVTQPRGVVLKGDGTPVGAKAMNDLADDKPIEKPQIPLSERARAYTRPTPPPPLPPRPNGFPAHADPTRAGARASRIIK